MSDPVSAPAWCRAYVESHGRTAEMLTGIRRRSERAKACLKVLVDASASLSTRVPVAISEPSAARAIALAEIAGTAWAVREVSSNQPVSLLAADATFLTWLVQRSSPWGGQFAPPLMAAADGDLRALLPESGAAEIEAGAQTHGSVNVEWLNLPAYRIEHAAAFLAELNAPARPRPRAVHQARAEALDQQIATSQPTPYAHVSAHAFAVHELTGIYGSRDDSVRRTMLSLVAQYPPHRSASLQATRVAALLSDALGSRARLALLDHILILLGPAGGDASIQTALARDSALVLLQLDDDAVEPRDLTTVATPALEDRANTPNADAISEILKEAEDRIVSAAAEREARYQRAVADDSLTDALAVVRAAAVDDDHAQAASLFNDIVRRHQPANPSELITVAPDALGPVALDSGETFDGPGAGCFTVLSPNPAEAAATLARVATRLLLVDDEGVEHPDSDAAEAAGRYTPNFVHRIVWCDHGAQVSLDTKGALPAPMGRTMIDILTDALAQDHVPALVTGWIPALDDRMVPWDPS